MAKCYGRTFSCTCAAMDRVPVAIDHPMADIAQGNQWSVIGSAALARRCAGQVLAQCKSIVLTRLDNAAFKRRHVSDFAVTRRSGNWRPRWENGSVGGANLLVAGMIRKDSVNKYWQLAVAEQDVRR